MRYPKKCLSGSKDVWLTKRTFQIACRHWLIAHIVQRRSRTKYLPNILDEHGEEKYERNNQNNRFGNRKPAESLAVKVAHYWFINFLARIHPYVSEPPESWDFCKAKPQSNLPRICSSIRLSNRMAFSQVSLRLKILQPLECMGTL